MSKKKRSYPDIPPRPLAAPIVDNHTHIDPAAHSVTALPAGSAVADLDPGSTFADILLAGMNRSGIRAAITSGCEVPDLEPTLALARRHPGRIFAALAIHPNDAPLHSAIHEKSPDGAIYEQRPWHREFSLDAAIAQVAELASAPEVVAIGETGLDYFRTGEAGKAAQQQAFRAHIALAKESGKPMQIHDRDAHRDVVEILKRDGAPERTIFHCFSGDVELAQICAENGWFASFAGPLTYHANAALRAAFLALPPQLVLVETDAPYLTPEPFRGHPNIAWAAAYTARYMAWLRLDPDAPATTNATAAEIQAAASAVTPEIELAWCEQLNANTKAVYGI